MICDSKTYNFNKIEEIYVFIYLFDEKGLWSDFLFCIINISYIVLECTNFYIT